MAAGAIVRDVARQWLPPLAVIGVVIAVWWAAVAATGTKVFPSPGAVVAAVIKLQEEGRLLPHVASSLARVAFGYLAGIVLGTPIGLYVGLHRDLSAAVNPVIQVLRPISPLAWLPIALVLVGVGNPPAILLIFVASLFPTVLAGMNAVMGVRDTHLRAGINLGLSRTQVLRRVILPSALPQLLTGYRLTLGIAWLVMVAAEMLAVDSGLGYLIIDSRNAGKRYDLVVAAMIMIGVVGLLMDYGMRWLEKVAVGRWKKAL